MSLSVSAFPEPKSRHSTKRWFFSGRLNTGGASFIKGIRHIASVQLKNSVARFGPKPSSQNLRPTPRPKLTVRVPTIEIDIIAVPHDDGGQSSTDISISPDASMMLDFTPSWPKCYGVTIGSNPRPRGISAGAIGTALRTVQQPRTRVNSEVTRAPREGTTSPSSPWQLKTKEMGPVPDLPAVTLTPADDNDTGGSPSSVTNEKKNVLLRGDSNPWRQREPKPSTLRRTRSSPSIKHSGRRTRERQPPPSPLPLLSVHIAPMRSGSRPTPSQLPPLLGTVRRPWTAPTTHATHAAAAQTTIRMPFRTPTGPCSSRGAPSNLPRSRSQPPLRTAASATVAGATTTPTTTRSGGASAAAVVLPFSSCSSSRAGSPAPALALAEGTRGHLQPSPVPARPKTAGAVAEMPEVLRGAPLMQRGGDGARRERRPRTAPESGSATRPLAPVVAMGHPLATAWERREMGAGGARERTTRVRPPNGPRPR